MQPSVQNDNELDTFWGRYRYFARVVNPINSFYQDKTIVEYQQRVIYLSSRENFLIDEELGELD